MRWNKNKCSLSSPLRTEIRRPKSLLLFFIYLFIIIIIIIKIIIIAR